MFEIGWTEMLVIAVVMIVVVGPKDLPKMLRTFGRTTTKLRSMAGDFQRQFNEALKEAELDDVKNSVDALRGLNPANEIKKQLNPFEKAASDVRAGLETLKPKDTPKTTQPADPAAAVAAEPLKTGAAAIPGEAPATSVPATAAKAVPASTVPGSTVPASTPVPAVAESGKKKAAVSKKAVAKGEGAKVAAKAKAAPNPPTHSKPAADTKPKPAPRKKKSESSAT